MSRQLQDLFMTITIKVEMNKDPIDYILKSMERIFRQLPNHLQLLLLKHCN